MLLCLHKNLENKSTKFLFYIIKELLLKIFIIFQTPNEVLEWDQKYSSLILNKFKNVFNKIKLISFIIFVIFGDFNSK